MSESLFLSVKQVWEEINRDSTASNFSEEILLHNKLLNFFHVGDYYYYIFNVASIQIEFVQDQMMTILGYAKEDFTPENIVANIHPDDLIHFVNFENTTKDFFSNLPIDKIQKYKVRYDYRIKKANGEYMRILQQVVTIQHTDEGGILRTLGMHTDITHLKQENKSSLCFIGLDNEPSFYDVKPNVIALVPSKFLTNRETEIVNCIANGCKSKEISELLFIEISTVETHRKNILKKTNCKTTNELIQKAIKMGWI
jgi:DNA-binding CsgD family transcriptional regulator